VRHWILPLVLLLPSFCSSQDLSVPERMLLLRLELAAAKLESRDFLGAVFAADQAIALEPRSARAYVLKATALNRLQRFEEAETTAWKAQALWDSHLANENIAWAQLNLGRYTDAVRSADRAITMRDTDAKAYAIRAYAFEALEERPAMLADLRRAAELDPVHFADILARALRGERIFAFSREPDKKPRSSRTSLAVLSGSSTLVVSVCVLALWRNRRRPLPGKISFPQMCWT